MISPFRQWLILLGIAAVYAATLVGVHGFSDTPQYALTKSLAENFSTGALETKTNAALPDWPGAAISAVPFRWIALVIAKARGLDRESAGGLVAILTALAAACVLSICALLLHFICLEMGCRAQACRVTMLSFAFASIAFPQAGTLSGATLATLTVLLFFHSYLRVRSGSDKRHHQAALGLAFFLAWISDRTTFALLPVFLILVLMQGKKLFQGKLKPALIFAPILAGFLVFISYNHAAFGDVFASSGGRSAFDVFGIAVFRRFDTGTALNVFLAGLRRFGSLSQLLPVHPYRPAGLLVEMPALAFCLFGILNLRSERMTKGPLYALLLIATVVFLVEIPRVEPSGAGYDPSRFLPAVALMFILVGSFVDYHLMTMRGIILKPLFTLAFAVALFLGFADATSIITTRTLAHPQIERLFSIFPNTPTLFPAGFNFERRAALLFPSLGNLPILLPVAALFLGLPFLIAWRTNVMKKHPHEKPAAAPASPAPRPAPVREAPPMTDREKFEEKVKQETERRRAAMPDEKDRGDGGDDGGWVN